MRGVRAFPDTCKDSRCPSTSLFDLQTDVKASLYPSNQCIML